MSNIKLPPLPDGVAFFAEYGGDVCTAKTVERLRLEAVETYKQQQGPVAWKHDCAALLTNEVELWIDACPHCGKPRTHPAPAPAQQPLTDGEIKKAITAAVKSGQVTWHGYEKDEQGHFALPYLSPVHYQIARAIEAALAERQGEAVAEVAYVTTKDARDYLNTNDKAFWVAGWNDCVDAMREGSAPAQPLSEADIQDMLACGNPTDEEMRLVRLGWNAAHGIGGEKPKPPNGWSPERHAQYMKDVIAVGWKK